MKFISLTVTTLLIALCASSQVQFNIFAGPQATTANYIIGGTKQETEMKIGFQAGIGLKVPFENKLFFAPAAFYSMKGYKVTYNLFNALPDVNAKDNNTSIHIFELAALLQYDFNTNPNHFFIKAGPSLDFQLIGNEKFNLLTTGSVDRKMKFSYGDYGHFSANGLLQLGYEANNGFIIFAQYTHGLASINNFDGGPQIKHRVFGISIGKFLNRKKIVIDTRNKE
jgi:Outer membrane protein beta-barrel domain